MAALGRVRLSPWLIVLIAAGVLLGDGAGLMLSLACVFLHEIGHTAMAAVLGAGVESVEIAPFGGVARLRGLESMSSGCSVMIALAGPLVSGILLMLCVCCAQIWPEQTAVWAQGMSVNAGLMLFNLLPAYPMDGGRVLCALMQGRSGLVRAQRFTAGLGLILGLCLALLGAASVRYVGKANLTLLLSGSYLCFAACRARRETPFTYLQMLLGRERELDRRRVLPVRTVAVRSDTPDAEVLSRMQPGALYRVVYLDEEMRVRQEKWESELLRSGK